MSETETMKSQFTDEHIHLVREFQRITGADKLAEMTCTESINQFKAHFSDDGESIAEDANIPENYLKLIKLIEEKHAEWSPILVFTVEEVIAQTFTADDLRVIITFCDTETGKKVLDKGGFRVPDCRGQCIAWSMEVYKRVTSMPEFMELANAPAGQTARELEAGTSIDATLPTDSANIGDLPEAPKGDGAYLSHDEIAQMASSGDTRAETTTE